MKPQVIPVWVNIPGVSFENVVLNENQQCTLEEPTVSCWIISKLVVLVAVFSQTWAGKTKAMGSKSHCIIPVHHSKRDIQTPMPT